MTMLTGWKEIAASLRLTSRSAQRWEALGLPVRRVSDSSHSRIIAFSDEIEDWARMKGSGLDRSESLKANALAFRATRRETKKLVAELRAARSEQRRLLSSIRDRISTNPLP